MQLNYERLTEERQRYCCDIEGRERDRQTDRQGDRQTDRGVGEKQTDREID